MLVPVRRLAAGTPTLPSRSPKSTALWVLDPRCLGFEPKGLTLKMGILSPQHGVVFLCDCVDDGIRKRQPLF